MGSGILNPLTVVITVLQVVVFARALRTDGRATARDLAKQASAPAFLTGLGILGTFAGILFGLLQFDVNSMAESVPRLLGGMTTAFITSVIGLAMALILRWAFKSFDRYQAIRATSGHTTSDLFNALQQQMQQQRKMHEETLSALGKLQLAIGGDGDSSLQSQTKSMRTEMRDGLDKLQRVLVEFSDRVSELGTKALIEALSSVIRDFNEKLTEQFGENFKQLNAAVLKLVEWQDNYASQVALLEQQFRAAAEAVTSTSDSMDRIARASAEIPKLVSLADAGIAGLNAQSDALERHLAAFAAVADRAQAGIPQIEANIERLTSGITHSVNAALESAARAHAEQSQSQQRLTAAYNQLLQDVRASVSDSQQQIKSLREAVNASLSTLEAQLKEHHARSAQNWEKTLRDSIERSDEVMREQVKALDSTLERELQRAVEALGGHLLGLHQKLVADYTPLVDAMRQVVELGRRSGVSRP